MIADFFMIQLAKILTFETDVAQQSFTLLASAALEQWLSYYHLKPLLLRQTWSNNPSFLHQVLLWSDGPLPFHDTIC